MSGTILERIIETKRAEVAEAKGLAPLHEIEQAAADAPPPRDFYSAVVDSAPTIRLIAELKKSSPSAGLIRPDLNPAEMAAIYAAFDVFVLASHREGMPRSVIEAQAMHRPVVATDIRGCREVVDPGVTGTLVPPRDAAALSAALGAMLEDPALAWTMVSIV